jgi:D-alanine-D-alanine ligase
MMRIGIFFGGQAREREISFAGGKTAMTHINKALFTPIPVFVDGLGNFILIKEELSPMVARMWSKALVQSRAAA